jgi:hypothetical protein
MFNASLDVILLLFINNIQDCVAFISVNFYLISTLITYCLRSKETI